VTAVVLVRTYKKKTIRTQSWEIGTADLPYLFVPRRAPGGKPGTGSGEEIGLQ